MKNCKHCGKPLNQSQYRHNKQYKSCPACSVADGEEHIFYSYPDAFGTTLLRSTQGSPEGAQSYCRICRGNNEPIHHGNKKCSEL